MDSQRRSVANRSFFPRKILARKAKEDAARKEVEMMKREADRLTQETQAKVIPLPKNDLKPVNLPENQGAETL